MEQDTPTPQAQAATVPTTVRPRPHRLEGVTYRLDTPLGAAYITVNANDDGEPFEVFLNVGKAGSDTAAVAEAIGRLISLLLRIPSPLPAARRLNQVVKQLKGIGGGRPMGVSHPCDIKAAWNAFPGRFCAQITDDAQTDDIFGQHSRKLAYCGPVLSGAPLTTSFRPLRQAAGIINRL